MKPLFTAISMHLMVPDTLPCYFGATQNHSVVAAHAVCLAHFTLTTNAARRGPIWVGRRLKINILCDLKA